MGFAIILMNSLYHEETLKLQQINTRLFAFSH